MKNKGATRWSDEILGILFLSLSILILVSLVSYNPWDPSLNVVSNVVKSVKTRNLVGSVGAFLSEGLMAVVGTSAYLIPLLIFIFSLSFFLHRGFQQKGLRLLGFAGVLLSSSVFLDLLVDPGKDGLWKAGGILGHALSRLFVAYLNVVGSYIITLTVFIVSAVLSTEIPFSKVLSFVWKGGKKIGGGAGKLFQHIKVSYIIVRERARRGKVLEKIVEKVSLSKDKVVPSQDDDAPLIVQKVEKSSRKIPDAQAPKKKKPEQLSFLEPKGKYTLPPIALLDTGDGKKMIHDEETLRTSSAILAKKLMDFGVEGKVTAVHPGPVITLYEVEPAAGVKVSQIANLSDDLALALRASSVRIIAPLPGKGTVGIEIPNQQRETVRLRDVLSSQDFEKGKGRLLLGLGKDISGEPVVTPLEKMPHLLVAGATGSGKSVAIHAMILSLVFRATPEDVKFLLVDPKMLELPIYEGLPHLNHPVVTEPKEAAKILLWAVREMEERYQKMNAFSAKNLTQYNQKAEAKMPYIVVVIDELADLMLISPKEVEEAIARLSQKARAAGIHLIVATQRPSVDVITGTIKANFAARVAMRVPSKVDSRTILDANGAESLLGEGDMLFMPPGSSRIQRVHGAYVSEGEIRKVVDFWKSQGEPLYEASIEEWKKKAEAIEAGEEDLLDDEKYEEAVAIVRESGRASISFIQRRLRIGYNRAARMIERMEREGVVKKAPLKQEWEVGQ